MKPEFTALPDDCRAVKERISAIADKWVTPLGLKWFRKFSVEYDYQYKEGAKECVGECRCSWEYLEAVVTFYLPACVGKDDDELEYAFIHECMHALVKEMRWTDDNGDNIRHEERVCTQLAMAFQWVRNFARNGHWPKTEIDETISPKSETKARKQKTKRGSQETR